MKVISLEKVIDTIQMFKHLLSNECERIRNDERNKFSLENTTIYPIVAKGFLNCANQVLKNLDSLIDAFECGISVKEIEE